MSQKNMWGWPHCVPIGSLEMWGSPICRLTYARFTEPRLALCELTNPRQSHMLNAVTSANPLSAICLTIKVFMSPSVILHVCRIICVALRHCPTLSEGFRTESGVKHIFRDCLVFVDVSLLLTPGRSESQSKCLRWMFPPVFTLCCFTTGSQSSL